MKKGMTRKELLKELAVRTGLSVADAERFLQALIGVAYDETKAERVFTIHGLCKLQVAFRKARKGRNPRTGEPLLIGARKLLKATALKKAKDTVTPRPPGLVTSLKITPIPIPEIAAEEPDPQEFASFGCPHCDAEIEAVQGPTDSTVACPACRKDLTIPAKEWTAPRQESADSRFVSFRCSHCHQDIEAAGELVGSEIPCPTCSETICVPSQSAEMERVLSPTLLKQAGGAHRMAGETMRIELPQELVDIIDERNKDTGDRRTVLGQSEPES